MLSQAETRLDELQVMVHGDNGPLTDHLFVSTLDTFGDLSDQGAHTLLTAYAAEGDHRRCRLSTSSPSAPAGHSPTCRAHSRRARAMPTPQWPSPSKGCERASRRRAPIARTAAMSMCRPTCSPWQRRRRPNQPRRRLMRHLLRRTTHRSPEALHPVRQRIPPLRGHRRHPRWRGSDWDGRGRERSGGQRRRRGRRDRRRARYRRAVLLATPAEPAAPTAVTSRPTSTSPTSPRSTSPTSPRAASRTSLRAASRTSLRSSSRASPRSSSRASPRSSSRASPRSTSRASPRSTSRASPRAQAGQARGRQAGQARGRQAGQARGRQAGQARWTVEGGGSRP